MPERIFDKEKRERIHASLAVFTGVDVQEYVKALEKVAKAAMTVWKDGFVLSSAQEAALYDSLSEVDWMEE